MRRLLLYTVWDFSNAQVDGICKKLLSQKKTLENMGYCVDFTYTKAGKAFIEQNGETIYLGQVPVSLNIFLSHRLFYKFLKKEKYDAVFVRHCASNPFYIQSLKLMKKNCPKVVVEIPTYPYDQELSGNWRLTAGRYVDVCTRIFMKKYVDRIVTYSKDDTIFGIPTIKIINGLDFSLVSVTKHKPKKNEFHFIAVAMLAPWHGYDRMIEGLNEYYKKERDVKAYFHVVGKGTELNKYKELIKKYSLDDYVVLYGAKSGTELDEVYNQCDIAVSSLGLHRIGLGMASPLKTREYGGRGMMMIATHAIDFMPDNTDLVYVAPQDDSPINIEEAIDYFSDVLDSENLPQIRQNLRESAKKVADMNVVFEPIKEFYMSE